MRAMAQCAAVFPQGTFSQTAKPLQSIAAPWRSTGHNGGPHLAKPLKGSIISAICNAKGDFRLS
jgi:hypothetical protein